MWPEFPARAWARRGSPEPSARSDQPMRSQLCRRVRISAARTARSAQSSRAADWLRAARRPVPQHEQLGVPRGRDRPSKTSQPQIRTKMR